MMESTSQISSLSISASFGLNKNKAALNVDRLYYDQIREHEAMPCIPTQKICFTLPEEA
jgi:hypothetical protein